MIIKMKRIFKIKLDLQQVGYANRIKTWKDYPEASYSRTLSSTKRSRCFNSAFSIVLCADFIFGLYLVTFYSIELLFQQQTKG